MSIRAKFAKWLLKDNPIGGLLIDTYGGTSSGINVSEDSAMRLAAVNACVRVLSEDVASLPEHIYRRLSGGGKERARNHALYHLLHDAPNPEMSAFTFKQTLMVNLLLTGNGYAFIEYNNAGQVMAMWVLPSDMVDPFRDSDTGELKYHVQNWRDVSAFEMLHVPGLSYDGLKGLSPIAYARESIGLSKAAEEFGGRFFSNGSHLGGVIELDTTLEDAAYERLKTGFAGMYKGLRNSHGIPILEGGAKFKPLGINQKDAQFLDTRKFQRSEIAAIFRVPPHMIGDLERATFSNIEHQSIEYLQRSLVPWLVRIEQEQCRKLLPPDERDLYVIEHDTANFLRGDTLSRMQAYSSAIQAGIMTANECRQRENLNPKDGGDELLRPMNMTTAANTQQNPPEPTGKRDFSFGTELRSTSIAQTAENLRVSQKAIQRLMDAMQKWLKKQANDILAIIDKEIPLERTLFVPREQRKNEEDEERKKSKKSGNYNTKHLLSIINRYYEGQAMYGSGALKDQIEKEVENNEGMWIDMEDALYDIANSALRDLQDELGEEANAIDSKWIHGFVKRYSKDANIRLSMANLHELENLLSGMEKVDRNALNGILWKFYAHKRNTDMATNEVSFCINEAKIAAYRKLGYESIWVSAMKCCQACTRMNGRIIRSLKPPLHYGCMCTVQKGEKKKNLQELTGHDTIITNEDARIAVEYGLFSSKIKTQLQNTHRKGTAEFERRKQEQGGIAPSHFTFKTTDIDIAKFVQTYSGSGEIIATKDGGAEETVYNTNQYGIVVNNYTGKEEHTHNFKIHYGINGIHIVPTYLTKEQKEAEKAKKRR